MVPTGRFKAPWRRLLVHDHLGDYGKMGSHFNGLYEITSRKLFNVCNTISRVVTETSLCTTVLASVSQFLICISLCRASLRPIIPADWSNFITIPNKTLVCSRSAAISRVEEKLPLCVSTTPWMRTGTRKQKFHRLYVRWRWVIIFDTYCSKNWVGPKNCCGKGKVVPVL